MSIAPAIRWQLLGVVLFLLTVSLGEMRLLDRLLSSEPAERDFAARSVAGVLSGEPPFRAWQHRFLAPALVVAVDRVVHDRLAAVALLGDLSLLAANLLLFALLRRRGGTLAGACLAVVAFGLCRLLAVYKLEYPWDGLGLLLFLLFGYAARAGHGLPWLAPFLLVGAFNHESALAIAVWYVLAPLAPSRSAAHARREMAAGAVTLALLLAAILLVRRHIFLGHALADLGHPGALPVLGNEWHLVHNLGQLFGANFRNERLFISLAVLSALGWLVAKTVRRSQLRAAVWSIVVLASIACFGYVNETRLYLPLLGFWFAYAWPAGDASRQGAAGTAGLWKRWE